MGIGTYLDGVLIELEPNHSLPLPVVQLSKHLRVNNGAKQVSAIIELYTN